VTTFHQNRPRGCAGGRSKRADRATPAAADQVPSAADRGRPHGRELRAVISRRLSSDERGHLGARPRRDRAGRGGDDRGGGRYLRAGDRNNLEGGLSFQSNADFDGGNYDEDNSEENSYGEDYEETGDCEETDDCGS